MDVGEFLGDLLERDGLREADRNDRILAALGEAPQRLLELRLVARLELGDGDVRLLLEALGTLPDAFVEGLVELAARAEDDGGLDGAVCACATTARPAAASTEISDPTQRFIAIPMLLPRVWTGARPGLGEEDVRFGGHGTCYTRPKAGSESRTPSRPRGTMAEYDLVIRNTTIATASDVVKGDIGIMGGRVVALGERLDKGRREIDGTGRIAVPGGIDAHVHFDQDTADGSVFCDDFESGSRAPRRAARRPSSPSPTRTRASRCATR